jgi:hypothetical protein
MSEPQNNLSSWVDEFPTAAVEHELKDLEVQAANIEREIRKRRRLLEARNMFLGIAEESNGQVRMATRQESNVQARRRALARARQVRDGEVEPDTRVEELLRRRNKAMQDTLDDLPKALPNIDVKGLAGQAALARLNEGSEAAAMVDRDPPADLSRAKKLIWFLSRNRGETWKLSEIRDRLVQEGVLADDPGDTHGLQVTASRLFRTGQIERPEEGHYRLPADDPEEGT